MGENSDLPPGKVRGPSADQGRVCEAPRAAMPDYEARKYGLSVNNQIKLEKIEPCFMPLRSAPQDDLFTFGYDVTFENIGSETLWFRNRNWLVTNGKGIQFDVFGPSVAGQQSLELKPQQRFTYKTAVPLNTPTGEQRGYFRGGHDPRGACESFITEEVEFKLDAPDWQIAKCMRNRANLEFADYAAPDDLKRLEKFLRGYDKKGGIDTSALSLNDRATLLEFERLLFKRQLIGYRDGLILLGDIYASFPETP